MSSLSFPELSHCSPAGKAVFSSFCLSFLGFIKFSRCSRAGQADKAPSRRAAEPMDANQKRQRERERDIDTYCKRIYIYIYIYIYIFKYILGRVPALPCGGPRPGPRPPPRPRALPHSPPQALNCVQASRATDANLKIAMCIY